MNRQEYIPVKETLIDGVGGCSASVFDQHEELVWCGNQTGHVTSYFSCELQKYTSFQAHSRVHAASEMEIKQIVTLASAEGGGGVLALTGDELSCFSRCGRCVFRYPSQLAGASLDSFMSMCLMNEGASLCLGGLNTRLFELDLNTLQCIRQADESMVEELDIAILKSVRNSVFVGHASGRIQLVDAATMRTQHTFEAHRGGLTDFDVRGNTLITIGYSPRFVGSAGGTSFVADRYVQVFDTRALKAHAPIACTLDPAFCAFTSPFSSSRIVVASHTGLVQLLDSSASLFHVPLASPFALGDALPVLTTLDVASSSQALLFGDSAGRVQVFAVADLDGTPRFNPMSAPTVFAHEGPFASISHAELAGFELPVSLADPNAVSFPLSAVPMRYAKQHVAPRFSHYAPYSASRPSAHASAWNQPTDRRFDASAAGSLLCSDWPAQLTEYYYTEPRRLPEELFKLCQRSQRGRDIFVCQLKGDQGDKFRAFLRGTPYRVAKRPPDVRRPPAPKPTAPLVPTLDYVSVDSYVNYIVQALYFIPPVRAALLTHLCVREACFWCELATVFQNMDCESGPTPTNAPVRRTVQPDAARASFSVETARGTVRSAPLATFLSRMGEVTALNLMPAYQNMLNDHLTFVQLVHGWNRFILQQLTHARPAYSVHSASPSPTPTLTSPTALAVADEPPTEDEFDQRELSVPLTTPSRPARLADALQTQCTTTLQCKLCGSTSERPTQTVALDVTWSPSLNKLPIKSADGESLSGVTEHDNEVNRSALAFAQLIAASFTNEQHIQAFCTQCAKFHAQVQRRCVSALPDVLAVQCQLSSKDTQTEPFRSANANASSNATKSTRLALPARLHLKVVDGRVKLADESVADDASSRTNQSTGAHSDFGASSTQTKSNDNEYEYELRSAMFLQWAQLRSLLHEFYSTKKQFPVAAFANSAPALGAFVKVQRDYIIAKRKRLFGEERDRAHNEPDASWFRFVESRVAPVNENEALEFSLPDFPVLLYYVRTHKQRDAPLPFGAPALDVNILLKSMRSQPPPTPSLLVPLALHDLNSLRNSPIGISAEYEVTSSEVSDVRYESSTYYGDSDEETNGQNDETADSELSPPSCCSAKPSSYAMHVGGTCFVAGQSSRSRGTLINPACLRVSRISLVRGAGSNYLDAFLDEQFDDTRPTPSSDPETRRFKRASDQDGKRHLSTGAGTSAPAAGTGSALRLLRFKLRVLVELGCTFVGFNLRRLFTVLRIAVPCSQLSDLGEMFRLPVSNAFTIRFLVWYYLHTRLPSPFEPGYAHTLLERYNVSALDDEEPADTERPSEQKESEVANISTKLLLGLLPSFEEAKFSLRLYARYNDLDSSGQRSGASEVRLEKLTVMWQSANESQFRIPDDDLDTLVRNFPAGLTPQAAAFLRVAGH